MALSCLIALVGRYLWGLGSATFEPGNFFAYLTIQSNITFALVTAFAGVWALRGPIDPPRLASLRAGVLTCTVTAGIVFAVIVQQAGVRAVRVDVPWSDLMLHFWLPAIALLEWFIAPGRGRPHWRAIAFVAGYAIVWGALTMLRGSVVGWYPYFFLDPAQLSSPGEFLLYSGLALTAFVAVGAGVIGLARIRPQSDL